MLIIPMFRGGGNILIRKNMCTEEEEIEIENPAICPHCQTETIKLADNRSYEYCTKCGLITRASYNYIAGIQFELPYGILII